VNIGQYARRMPGRSKLTGVWVDFCTYVCKFTMQTLFGYRMHGRERVPRTGPLIFVCNHQSYLDPILNGVAVHDRSPRPMAKKELFAFKPFAWLLKSVGTIPLRGSAADKESMRIAIAELEAGRTVLMYPEGSRSYDGAMLPFKAGVGILLKRSSAHVVPIGTDGAGDAWPRGKGVRLFRRIDCEVGEAIPMDDLLADGVKPALARLEREVDRLRMRCRERIRARTKGRQPSAGPGDVPFAAGEQG
jgi:1-acyl-sn-glycerol-3-phosphate acyltransferase